MNLSCNSLTTTLAQDELLSLTDSNPFEIVAQTGSLWITLDHDTRDIILEPGQRYSFQPGNRALVVALKNAQFLLNRTATAPAKSGKTGGFDLFGAFRRVVKPVAQPVAA